MKHTRFIQAVLAWIVVVAMLLPIAAPVVAREGLHDNEDVLAMQSVTQWSKESIDETGSPASPGDPPWDNVVPHLNNGVKAANWLLKAKEGAEVYAAYREHVKNIAEDDQL